MNFDKKGSKFEKKNVCVCVCVEGRGGGGPLTPKLYAKLLFVFFLFFLIFFLFNFF